MWKNYTISELLISYGMKTKMAYTEGREKTTIYVNKKTREKCYAHIDIDEVGKIVVENCQMWKNYTLRIAN